MSQRCCNHYCNKELTEEDKTDFGGSLKERIFLVHHLCNECFNKFDVQKKRGRWQYIEDQLGLTPPIMTQAEKDIRKQPYTESLTEWISWQGSNG